MVRLIRIFLQFQPYGTNMNVSRLMIKKENQVGCAQSKIKSTKYRNRSIDIGRIQVEKEKRHSYRYLNLQSAGYVSKAIK